MRDLTGEAGGRGASATPVVTGLRLLTREELAEVLQISVRTVDAMLAAEELPCVRMRGAIVRFYLPDVVRHLTVTAMTRKHARRTRLRVES
jgi:excisionase family DNA binding protein